MACLSAQKSWKRNSLLRAVWDWHCYIKDVITQNVIYRLYIQYFLSCIQLFSTALCIRCFTKTIVFFACSFIFFVLKCQQEISWLSQLLCICLLFFLTSVFRLDVSSDLCVFACHTNIALRYCCQRMFGNLFWYLHQHNKANDINKHLENNFVHKHLNKRVISYAKKTSGTQEP